MNALLDNPYTQRWNAIGRELPTPKAICSYLRTGIYRELQSPFRPLPKRSTILADFLASFTKCNIQPQVIRDSQRV